MIETVDDFSTFAVAAPELEQVRAEYRSIAAALGAAASTQERQAQIRRWDELRRRLETWSALTNLRFEQDTTNERYKEARAFRDEIQPKLTALDVDMKRTLLDSPDRAHLERALGRHAFELWSNDVRAFDPSIESDLTEESTLASRYTELIAAAELDFDGKRLNLAGVVPYLQDADRDVRHRAQETRWRFFSEQKTELDDIYDKLVRLRHGMACKLDYDSFVPLAYKRMSRVDYAEGDVRRFRDEVAETVVPLGRQILERRMKRMGIEDPRFWDEPVSDPRGQPKPLGDHDWILKQTRAAFAAMHPDLGSFFDMMTGRGLLDLKNRDGKAGGGFCTSFPSHGVPFIFASFNGTDKDVHVLVHEMGHAFQNWRSRELQLIDYLWPAAESAEIDSIGMEFLSLPQMHRLFGADGQRFVTELVEDAFVRMPYMAAVDHFQHLVYARPEATPAERDAMWQEVEARYLPWRNYGDLEHPARGGFWQSQLHIYQFPFYYIDYALAATCALQFWAKSLDDRGAAMADYVALCDRGGEAPFLELVKSANLRSPFEAGVMTEIGGRAREFVGL